MQCNSVPWTNPDHGVRSCGRVALPPSIVLGNDDDDDDDNNNNNNNLKCKCEHTQHFYQQKSGKFKNNRTHFC